MPRWAWGVATGLGVSALLGYLLVVGCRGGAGAPAAQPTSSAASADAPASTEPTAGQSPNEGWAAAVSRPAGEQKPLLPFSGEGGECADGVDNDGDGRVDWQDDTGCHGPQDRTEAARPRAEENGFTTFDPLPTSRLVYVSASGNDASDGQAARPVRTIRRAGELVRDGQHDFILIKRGETFRGETLSRFKSGQDKSHPMVIATYGPSLERPRIEVEGEFIDHNGRPRSYLAVIGLHLVHAGKDPKSASFDGNGKQLLRFVGEGSGILVEDCVLSFSGIGIQGSGDRYYDDVQIRRTVIEQVYSLGTCKEGDKRGSSSHRPSGIFAKQVRGLLIEDSLLDHNGWNEDAETACATIFNHNAYLNASQLVIRNNFFARASSIHVKLKASDPGEMRDILIEDNFMIHGEVGVSIGGNNDAPHRFTNSIIRSNVFFGIGTTRPTGRKLAWAVEARDNDGLLIQRNLFLNQEAPGVTNAFAVDLTGGTERNVKVLDNFIYRVPSRGLRAQVAPGHQGIEVSRNVFFAAELSAAMIEHDGPFDGYTYSQNRYASAAPPGSWFKTKGGPTDLDGWTKASGETGGASLGTPQVVDARSAESYGKELGVPTTLPDLLAAFRSQSRLHWDEARTARAINAYMRAGYSLRP